MTRGIVLPLTQDQRVTRMRWLAGLVSISQLDSVSNTVKREVYSDNVSGYEMQGIGDTLTHCAAGYYLLKDHNGGKDPTAIDPFDRWTKPGSNFVNRTADCIGAMAWCGGFDRYQPTRFAHLYDGWINTDSMLMDAHGPQKCFRPLNCPAPGCFVVFASGSGGHSIGHIGGVIEAPDGDRWTGEADAWAKLVTVDNAARGANRSNIITPDVLLWMRCHARFVVSTMTP